MERILKAQGCLKSSFARSLSGKIAAKFKPLRPSFSRSKPKFALGKSYKHIISRLRQIQSRRSCIKMSKVKEYAGMTKDKLMTYTFVALLIIAVITIVMWWDVYALDVATLQPIGWQYGLTVLVNLSYRGRNSSRHRRLTL